MRLRFFREAQAAFFMEKNAVQPLHCRFRPRFRGGRLRRESGRQRTAVQPHVIWIGCLLVLCCSLATASDEWTRAVDALNAKSFAAKIEAASALTGFGHPRTRPLLEAWLEGLLYQRKGDTRLVVLTERGDGFAAEDAATGDDLGAVRKSGFRKVRINNRLRKELRNLLAGLGVRDPDPAVRFAAAHRIRDSMDPESLALLRDAAVVETDPDVRRVMDETFALQALRSGDADEQRRLAALDVLGSSLRLETYNELVTLAGEGESEAIRARAANAANRVKAKRDFYAAAEVVFFGLSLGSVLVLAAIGLAITFGVMGVINMAHGEMIMLGAYTAFVMQQIMPDNVGAALLIAVPLAFLVSGGVGVLLEQGVIRFLYGRPLETLLATFGVSLILQQLVRSVFSPLNRPVATPEWMSGALYVNDAFSLTYTRLYILVFSLLVFFILLAVVKNTRFGLQLRATSQNRAMARAMGVRSGRVDALTFGLGSGIAGIAGVGLSQLTNVGPNMGQAYIIDSFMVIVFGGTGNLWGTLYASMFLGTINKLFEPYTGAMLAKILVLVFIILFIQKRPRGLFPQRGRAADN